MSRSERPAAPKDLLDGEGFGDIEEVAWRTNHPDPTHVALAYAQHVAAYTLQHGEHGGNKDVSAGEFDLDQLRRKLEEQGLFSSEDVTAEDLAAALGDVDPDEVLRKLEEQERATSTELSAGDLAVELGNVDPDQLRRKLVGQRWASAIDLAAWALAVGSPIELGRLPDDVGASNESPSTSTSPAPSSFGQAPCPAAPKDLLDGEGFGDVEEVAWRTDHPEPTQIALAYAQHVGAFHLQHRGDADLTPGDIAAELGDVKLDRLRRKLRGQVWATATDLASWALLLALPIELGRLPDDIGGNNEHRRLATASRHKEWRVLKCSAVLRARHEARSWVQQLFEDGVINIDGWLPSDPALSAKDLSALIWEIAVERILLSGLERHSLLIHAATEHPAFVSYRRIAGLDESNSRFDPNIMLGRIAELLNNAYLRVCANEPLEEEFRSAKCLVDEWGLYELIPAKAALGTLLDLVRFAAEVLAGRELLVDDNELWTIILGRHRARDAQRSCDLDCNLLLAATDPRIYPKIWARKTTYPLWTERLLDWEWISSAQEVLRSEYRMARSASERIQTLQGRDPVLAKEAIDYLSFWDPVKALHLLRQGISDLTYIREEANRSPIPPESEFFDSATSDGMNRAIWVCQRRGWLVPDAEQPTRHERLMAPLRDSRDIKLRTAVESWALRGDESGLLECLAPDEVVSKPTRYLLNTEPSEIDKALVTFGRAAYSMLTNSDSPVRHTYAEKFFWRFPLRIIRLATRVPSREVEHRTIEVAKPKTRKLHFEPGELNPFVKPGDSDLFGRKSGLRLRPPEEESTSEESPNH